MTVSNLVKKNNLLRKNKIMYVEPYILGVPFAVNSVGSEAYEQYKDAQVLSWEEYSLNNQRALRVQLM